MRTIQETRIENKILVIDLLDETFIQLRSPSFHVMNVFQIIIGDGIHYRHDVLAFKAVVVSIAFCKVGTIAEIFRFIFIANLVADFSFFGLYIIPGRVLQM